MIQAFGEQARRWAATARATEPVIAVDESAVLEATVEAVRRRLRGESFALAVFFDEDQDRFVREWAPKALANSPSLDHRLRLCSAIATGSVRADGKSQAELGALSGDVFGVARGLWGLTDTGVVVSELAYGRLAVLFDRWHPRRIAVEQHDPQVPTPAGPRDGAEHVVVWAPEFEVRDIPIPMFSLEHVHAPVYAICGDGELPEGVHRCSLEQSEPLLRSAAAILVVRTDGPGTALALAAFGVPLVTTRASGAHEFLENVSVYEPWHRESAVAAVLTAFGSAPPAPRAVPAAQQAPAPPASVRERAPLASIVVPTYNRPELLEYTLESISRQSYPNVEIVVVNDAGNPVPELAARYGAAYVDRDTNGGHAAVLNTGIAHARGSYIGFIDDDDLFLPDHVETLVAALERSGGSIAHANSLMVLQGAGRRVIGFSPGVLVSWDMETILWSCPMLGMQAMMVRREVFEELGNFDESIAPNDDYEMMVRLALRYEPLHVDRITCLYRYTATTENMSIRMGPRYADLYEEAYKRYPFPDRPLLAAKRRALVEAIRNAGGIRLTTVATRLRRPIPLQEFFPPKM